ncbi:VOC family protein [Mycolicibacterium komossense]|uniref:VOC family protein n=1 Tax=Mycolicibacterium komossense TaxID=1779 RepID=A0ABT3CG39_9MYCO|nr:VOC family protein [Mycolicibacterium komossense]MCV7228412.1 VOC family protein [Mycolicibacterium komossense]
MIDSRFSHLVVGVTDMDRALQFYRGLLGMDVVFDQSISGEPFDTALGSTSNQDGRVVGGLIGGLMVELLSLGATGPASPGRRPFRGNQNISLSVADLDATHGAVLDAGYRPEQEPFEISGVRMFFVKDPDGMPVEFIEFPGAARTSYELHRGTAPQNGERT